MDPYRSFYNDNYYNYFVSVTASLVQNNEDTQERDRKFQKMFKICYYNTKAAQQFKVINQVMARTKEIKETMQLTFNLLAPYLLC